MTKKWMIASLSAIIVILMGVGGFLYYENVYKIDKQVDAVMGFIDAEQFEQAVAEYTKVKNGYSGGTLDKILAKLDDRVRDRAKNRAQLYIDGQVDYPSAVNFISKLGQYTALSKELDQYKETIEKIKKSRDSFDKAKRFFDNKDYIPAVKKYKEVINEDVKNYETAKAQIELSLKTMLAHYLNKADQLLSERKYEEAYNQAKALEEFYPDHQDIKSKQESYLKAMYDNNLQSAEQLVGKKQYDDAIATIQSTERFFPNDAVLKTRLAGYESAKKKAIEEEKLRRENRKKELLAKVTSKYDDMKEVTEIVPKGYSATYINVSESVNIEPRISVFKDGTAVFSIVAGFEQDDWVFTDRIIFNVDDEIFKWELSFGDRDTQVFWGGISEWTNKFSGLDKDLLEQMGKVVAAKKAKMRFEGSAGHRDHTITANEKANIKLLLELYGYYNNKDLEMLQFADG